MLDAYIVEQLSNATLPAQVDALSKELIDQERREDWTALKKQEHKETRQLTKEEYEDKFPEGDYTKYLISYGSELSYEDWLTVKIAEVATEYEEYLGTFKTPVSLVTYITYGTGTTKRELIETEEVNYTAYLKEFTVPTIDEFRKSNPDVSTNLLFPEYRKYVEELPKPKDFFSYLVEETSTATKAEVNKLIEAWTVYKSELAQPLSKTDWLKANSKDSYEYETKPITDTELIAWKITKSHLFDNFAINPLAPADPLGFEQVAKIYELKEAMRKELGYEIGDTLDNLTDTIRQVTLGYCISAGSVTDEAVIAEFKAYNEAMLAGYGGGGACMKVLGERATSFNNHVVKRFYAAKTEVMNATTVDEVRRVTLPKFPE